MKSLTPIQQSVISYIIADNEEDWDTLERNPVTPYMCALNGEFEPDMPFFLGSTETAGLVLYVQSAPQDSPEQCRTRCGLLKNRLLEIADFIICLLQKGYVRTICKTREEPPDMLKQRRSVAGFIPAEQETLRFAGSFRLIPRLVLYEYWEAMRPEAVCREEQFQEALV